MDQKKDTLKLFAQISRGSEIVAQAQEFFDAALAAREILENAEELKREAKRLPAEIADLHAKKDSLQREVEELQEKVTSKKAEYDAAMSDWTELKKMASG